MDLTDKKQEPEQSLVHVWFLLRETLFSRSPMMMMMGNKEEAAALQRHAALCWTVEGSEPEISRPNK